METNEKKPSVKAEVKKDIKKQVIDKVEPLRDKMYYLLGNNDPLIFKIASRHTQRHPLMWFDPEKGHQRELRYATNQVSPFVDEQKGQVTLSHVLFENGTLNVSKTKQNLQMFLDHHPAKNKIFAEYNPVAEAKDDLQELELEIIALNKAYEVDVEHGEAILRVEQGSSVSKSSSKEIKRDLLVFAKRNPKLFLSLVEDENVVLRNFAINAKESNIINLSQDQKTFSWASNGRQLMTVPFDENPYSAMAAWFQTDEGLAVYKSIEKKIK